MEPIEVNLTLQHSEGLHARPAAMFVHLAKKYTAHITVCYKEREVNAKSILSVLTLGAHFGAQITVRACGDDAELALEALQALVVSNFSED